jgi:2-C-methyl-D-erythritol 4-phosphate cytidylyltransferase
MIVAAVLVAAGSGSRLGADVPKAFVEVNDQPLLEYAVQRFLVHRAVRDVIVVVPAGWTEQAQEVLAGLVKSLGSVDDLIGQMGIARPAPVPAPVVVPGGRTRQESVGCGLAALADDVDAVLVHDVARAFVPRALITRVARALADGADAVVPTLPVTDTVRTATASGLGPTLDRAGLVSVQTPQGFRRSVLVAAHESGRASGRVEATDDASLVEALGVDVVAVPGAPEAFKVTVPLDLRLAEVVADELAGA